MGSRGLVHPSRHYIGWRNGLATPAVSNLTAIETSLRSDKNPMTRRPRAVTLVSYLFIAAGIIGFAYHVSELQLRAPFAGDALEVLLLRLLALVAGIFMLRGANWARWIAILWLAYHVVLSAFHSWSETVMHVLLLAVITYVLLRRDAAEYFRGTTRSAQQSA
jgi:hypothetical protein